MARSRGVKGGAVALGWICRAGKPADGGWAAQPGGCEAFSLPLVASWDGMDTGKQDVRARARARGVIQDARDATAATACPHPPLCAASAAGVGWNETECLRTPVRVGRPREEIARRVPAVDGGLAPRPGPGAVSGSQEATTASKRRV